MYINRRAAVAFYASHGGHDQVDVTAIDAAVRFDMVRPESIADALGCAPHELPTLLDELKPDYK